MNSKDPLLDANDILVVHSQIKDPISLEEIYQDYKNQVYFISGYSKVYLTDEELWVSKVHDRSWLFRHHCLVSVALLIDSYYLDQNKDKLLLAYKIVDKWFKFNFPSSPSDMAWHDHSTAFRLLHLTKLYLLLKSQEDSEYLNQLVFICNKHMEKLSDKNFYMPKHNHGLDQDIALFTAASVLNCREMKETAIKRFWQQIDNLFSKDGSYLEHSPYYVYLIMGRLLGFYNILLKTDKKIGEKLQKRINKIIIFFINILQPDGTFPTIGDSELKKFEISQKYWENISGEFYAILKSIKEKNSNPIQLPLDSYYPYGGYVVFRNNWKNDLTTNQIIFYSSFHSRVHKHHDDLSFTLYGHGMPLLIDGGKFTYQYERPERKYITSTYGHNTVRINHKETDLTNNNIGKSGILSFLTTKNIGYASGFHTLYEGVTHRRMLFYLKPEEIIILDLIKGGKKVNTELTFNFNSQLISEMKNSRIVANYQESPVLYLKSLLGETDFNKYRGEVKPLRGWSSPIYGKFEENDLLIQSKKGKVVKYATYIGMNSDCKVSNFIWDDDGITFKWNNFEVKVHLTDFYEHIFINDKYFKTTKNFDNLTLLKAITNNEQDFFK
ncbi:MULTISPECIES: heparinase II/III family protein [unclassified Priestia]|uniref:heparinase II/III domain-containing protein n=1 Tax=unclassified Priestia TaxID=2800374 RepID=UPI00366ADDEA